MDCRDRRDPAAGSDRTFHDELRHVHEMALQEARRSLSIDGRLPRPLHTRQLTTRAAELLEWVWTRTLRADWPRRQRIFEADIVSRTQRLSSGGWAAAVDGMRHELRWLGDGRLRVSAYEHPPRTIADADLMFIPSTSPPARVTWAEPDRYAVIYPCAGLLADTPATPSPSRTLAKLIGPARATILDQLREPRSTNQLVALTGYSLGSVGGHLKTLLDAELVQRRRSGRSVLYYRTSLGDKLTCIHQ